MRTLMEIQSEINNEQKNRKATPKQLAYAERITEVLGVKPNNTSFYEVSEFIGKYADEFKETLANMPTDYELKKFVVALHYLYGNPLSDKGEEFYEKFKKDKLIVSSFIEADKKALNEMKKIIEEDGTPFVSEILEREYRQRHLDEDAEKRLNQSDYKRSHSAEMHELRSKLNYQLGLAYEEEELEAFSELEITALKALLKEK